MVRAPGHLICFDGRYACGRYGRLIEPYWRKAADLVPSKPILSEDSPRKLEDLTGSDARGVGLGASLRIGFAALIPFLIALIANADG